jgi:hypothetical protein
MKRKHAKNLCYLFRKKKRKSGETVCVSLPFRMERKKNLSEKGTPYSSSLLLILWIKIYPFVVPCKGKSYLLPWLWLRLFFWNQMGKTSHKFKIFFCRFSVPLGKKIVSQEYLNLISGCSFYSPVSRIPRSIAALYSPP